MEETKQTTLESAKQVTQRKFTQLRNWLHGNDDVLKRLLNQVQLANPDKDSTWCIDQLWLEQRTWRF
jgi:hypothetical protein